MFSKLLVANRGEIAVRVIRTCKDLGVETVAIYSDADVDALHVRLADEAFRVGPSPPADSYMNLERIVGIAEESGAEAIHPGYGFRSEHWDFAAACEEMGISFVGPSSRTLSLTGDKVDCRKIARAAGVPVLPGSDDAIDNPDEGIRIAKEIGYPIMLKPAFGGGGRGIREAKNDDELRENFRRAESEARGAFGKTGVYLEKVIRPARHIEFQILSDRNGKTTHLGERECSIQRRHQKLIEMTPSPVVDEEARKMVGRLAITVAQTVGYRNVGTVEFLRDVDGNFYFIEINSRLQVEHPVTEEATGIDLVEQQLRIASGERMTLSKDAGKHRIAAIQCRINAEDPTAGFAPSVGRIDHLMLPGGPGIRVDSALYHGMEVSEFYDSLVAKVIAWGRDLEVARRRMLSALAECEITGIKTTIDFQRHVLAHKSFIKWDLTTDFVSNNYMVEAFTELASQEKQAAMEKGAAVAATMLSEGLHMTVPLQRGSERIRSQPGRTSGGARFYDAV